MIRVRVSVDPIDVAAEMALAERPEAGAVASFCGLVRADDGVDKLELEHYPGATEAALERMETCRELEKYLSPKFITGYVAVKRAEQENYHRVISSWEREFLMLSV